VSDPRLDALADSARNRGLRLVRSRVRSPEKRRFGKVGLADKAGKAVFGMDAKGPAAKPEDVEEYLRNLGANDWGASLNVAVLPRKRKPAKASRTAANDTAPPRKPKPAPPPPKFTIREAIPADSRRIAELIGLLEHDLDERTVRNNLQQLKAAGELPLVVTVGKEVIGLCGVHKMVTIHRSSPVGRITIVVVAEQARAHGVGRMLVDAAEQWCRSQGCALIEVTSNDRLTKAHAFYRHLGYERSSIRFFKRL
jgi:GNAT superfamily N-acetyltransferase